MGDDHEPSGAQAAEPGSFAPRPPAARDVGSPQPGSPSSPPGESRRSTIPPPPYDSQPPPPYAERSAHRGSTPPEGEKKRLFERAIPELVKRVVERAVESGVERLAEGPEKARNFVGDLKLPKEVLQTLYDHIDDTKNGIYRAVAKEIRDVLEHTQFADEITKVLTKLSFEIKTEIRFIPNEAAKGDRDGDEGTGLPKPNVTAQVTVKDRSKEGRPGRRRREDM